MRDVVTSRELTGLQNPQDGPRMGIDEIIRRLGGDTKAASLLGVKRTAVAMWKHSGQLPPKHVPGVARALGVRPEVIWPELAATTDGPRPADASDSREIAA